MDDIQIAKEIRTAIKQGDAEQVVNLIKEKKDRLSIITPFGTWLHVASSFGKLEIVKCLVELGADIDKRAGVFNAGAIKEAASGGDTDIVQYLLSCGAKMDVSEPERNPLFGAIYGGSLEIAQLLVENGIDYNVKYTGKHMKNMGALEFAEERGQREIFTYLSTLP